MAKHYGQAFGEDRMSSQMDGAGSYQCELYCVFCTHPHAHMRVSVLICDHTYGVVDGFGEQGRAVREAGQHELDQHEAKVNVEGDIAKDINSGILHRRGRRRRSNDHFLEAAAGGGLSSGLSPLQDNRRQVFTSWCGPPCLVRAADMERSPRLGSGSDLPSKPGSAHTGQGHGA